MLPCLRAGPAIRWWRAGGLLRASGWAIRAARTQFNNPKRLSERNRLLERDRNRDRNDGTQATREKADGHPGQGDPVAQAARARGAHGGGSGPALAHPGGWGSRGQRPAAPRPSPSRGRPPRRPCPPRARAAARPLPAAEPRLLRPHRPQSRPAVEWFSGGLPTRSAAPARARPRAQRFARPESARLARWLAAAA